MPSHARAALEDRLGDLDQLLTMARPGPLSDQAAAVSRSAVVLLYAAWEVFVEGLFTEYVHALTCPQVAAQITAQGTDRFNNPNVDNVRQLFRRVLPDDVWDGVAWQCHPRDRVRERLNMIGKLRHKVAHRVDRPKVSWRAVKHNRAFIVRLADKLDRRVSSMVEAVTGSRPW
jgi:hypothetical protein